MDTTSLNSEIGIMLFQTIPIRKSVDRVMGLLGGRVSVGRGTTGGSLWGIYIGGLTWDMERSIRRKHPTTDYCDLTDT